MLGDGDLAESWAEGRVRGAFLRKRSEGRPPGFWGGEGIDKW